MCAYVLVYGTLSACYHLAAACWTYVLPHSKFIYIFFVQTIYVFSATSFIYTILHIVQRIYSMNCKYIFPQFFSAITLSVQASVPVEVCVCVCLRADRTFHSSLLSPRRTAPHFGTCLLQVNCCYVLLTLTSINLLLSFCHFQALHCSLPHILPYCVPWWVVLTYRHVFGIHRNIVGDKVVWYWLTVV